MCGQMEPYDWSLWTFELDQLQHPPHTRREYEHTFFVGGRGWGRTAVLNELVDLDSARDDDFHREYCSEFPPDDRPIDEIVWQHFRDRIERSDHAPNDDHGSLRFPTAL